MSDIEIKGPFSYSGNKFRIYNNYLKKILSPFDMIHEPFLGSGVCLYNSKGGGVGIDVDKNVVMLHNSLHDRNLLKNMKKAYSEFFPNGRDQNGYLNLRSSFNESFLEEGISTKNVHLLHILIQLGFNSLLRFGSKGFNTPFGKKNIDFNRIKLHMDIAVEKQIKVLHGNYYDLKIENIKKDDVVYLDPPYAASKFQYGGWNKEDEISLLDYITFLDSKGIKFILSNTFYHRGVQNLELKNWAKNFDTLHITMSYNSWAASVNSVEREENTDEVIITNIQGCLNQFRKSSPQLF